MRDQLTNDTFTASGQSRVYTGSCADTNKPFRVTVAWTDAPGSTVGNAYVNNLTWSSQWAGLLTKGMFSLAPFQLAGAALT